MIYEMNIHPSAPRTFWCVRYMAQVARKKVTPTLVEAEKQQKKKRGQFFYTTFHILKQKLITHVCDL